MNRLLFLLSDYITPIVSLFQSFVFVWKSVKLHPDNDGHIGDTVLSVEALPACVANKMVARDLKQ